MQTALLFFETISNVFLYLAIFGAYFIIIDCCFQIGKLVKLYKTEYKPLGIPFKVFANIRNHKMFLEDYKTYGPLYVFKKGRSY